MKVKMRKLRRNIIRIFFCIFITATGLIGILYLSRGYIRQGIRNRICSMVIKYEEELSEIVETYYGDDDGIGETDENGIYCDGSSDETVYHEMFDKFHLITTYSDTKDKMMAFIVWPSLLPVVLWDSWIYGFYYSEDGEAKGVLLDIEIIEESENEMRGIGNLDMLFEFDKYWYKTERIMGNWWFFESGKKKGCDEY